MSLGSFAVRGLHVGSSDRECVRHVLRKLRPEARLRAHRTVRHKLLRDALKAHRKNQGLFKKFSM